jgi:predicted tellurium resistance membrane protein TerC
MRIVLIALLAALLGFFTPILISFLFLVWFDAYWRQHEVEALTRAAMPSQADNVPESILPESIKPLTEDPLPPAFQRWMDNRK